MSIQGKLSTMSLADVLQWLNSESQNGVLEVNLDQRQRLLGLEDGLITNVKSNEDKYSPLIYLLKRGILSEKQVAKIKILLKYTTDGVITIISDLELIGLAEFQKILRSQFQEIVLDTIEGSEGNFTFWKNQKLDPLPFHIVPLSTMELIMEAGRRKDEWVRIRNDFPNQNLVLAHVNTGLDMWHPQNSYEAKRISSLVDGKRSIYEICEESGYSDFITNYTLWTMFNVSMLTLVGEKEGPPPALIRELLDKAEAHVVRRDYLIALSQLNQIRELDPRNKDIKDRIENVNLLIRQEKAELFKDDKIIPRLTKSLNAIDVRDLPMTAQEGFLLSRIDGLTSIQRILSVIRVEKNSVYDSLYAFYKKGIVSFSEPKAIYQQSSARKQPLK